jgi:cytochrome oxidase assembly protein ShyY1
VEACLLRGRRAGEPEYDERADVLARWQLHRAFWSHGRLGDAAARDGNGPRGYSVDDHRNNHHCHDHHRHVHDRAHDHDRHDHDRHHHDRHDHDDRHHDDDDDVAAD